MKFAVPWSVKGIRPEARETAKEAARRSGMPLGEWLNSIILQQAEEDGGYDDEDSYSGDMSSVHQRLDDISHRIDKFSRSGPAAYAPKHVRREQSRSDHDRQIAELIARLDRRIEQFVNLPQMMAQRPMAPGQMPMPQAARPLQQPIYPGALAARPAPPGLDRAVAEIAARQRALNGQQGQPPPQAQAPAMAQPAPVLTPVPAQDLSGLEEHLRLITDQIETLRRPGVEDAINALRAELGDIGNALNEAMPRRAIEKIEKQIQGLTQRVAENRQSGAGVDAGALSGIEHGLAEVRDALRGLTPAENLVGFNEAVDGLAHKIDLIVAQKDPQTLGQLEHAITALREMAGHVASDEAVGRLAAQVQQLAAKVDHFGGGGGSEALNNLEHRISALAEALAERTQNGGTVPPRLEALVESLSDKIEQIQQIQHSRGDNVAAGHLEDQIVALVQRLDASDSRLGHLEAIERGLGDLLVHIEEMRADKGAGGVRETDSPSVIDLKNDIARTQDALDAVHGTLGLVVDRLASIESVARGDRRAMADPDTIELTQPVGRIAARAVVETPPSAAQPATSMPQPAQQTAPPPMPQRPADAPAPQAAPKRLPPAARLAIDPNLPPDQPLEPGSGRPSSHASARIAASEAALGGARPAAAGAPVGKSGFIAAARRAAQAAVETATPRAPKPQEPIEAYESEAGESQPLRASMMRKIKSLFIAASLVAIVIGSIQIASTFFDFGGSGSRRPELAQAPESQVTGELNTGNGGDPAAPAQLAANPPVPLSPPVLPDYISPAPMSGDLAEKMPTVLYPAGQTEPSLLNPPALSPPALPPGNDVTGSIARNSAKARPMPPPGLDAAELPLAIGSAKLRNAAAEGDAGAAYEVAVRLAEGSGVPANAEEAAHWYERAAAKGLAPAQFRYASLLEKGLGVKKNLAQARKLYLAAASKGHAKAMHNLAVLYAEGIDGKPDYATAVTWFRKAAEHGVADSQYNLGILCARGLGTDKDDIESYKWFALAANQGDREAVKKRDEMATRLDPEALAGARNAVNSFVAKPQPHSAIAVPTPQGGWDEITGAPARPKARTGRAISVIMPAPTYDAARR
ncbi:MAG TPA: hypothetical protein VFC54_12475 [Pseudolabrys sp.]|nr:hypothetical protein [Pseudolabrys sp.]